MTVRIKKIIEKLLMIIGIIAVALLWLGIFGII
jgi:hypothetical protein